MTLQEAKNEVIEREKLAHKDDYKMFYPDPVNSDDCAQCGKSKELHISGYDGKPFFCQVAPTKKHEQLIDEAAELYALQYKLEIEMFVIGLEEIKCSAYDEDGNVKNEWLLQTTTELLNAKIIR